MREILMALAVILVILVVAIIVSICMNYGHFLVGVAIFVTFILSMLFTMLP